MVAANRPIPWPFVIVVGGALAGLVIGLVSAQRNDTPTSVWVALMLAAIGSLVGLALVLIWTESRAFHLRRQVPLTVTEVYDHAEQWFGRAPWTLARNDGRELVFWRRTEPVIIVVIVLLLFGVIPGILYYFWARGTQTIHIAVRPISGGSNLEIMVQPRAADSRKRVVDFYNSLHDLL